MERGKFIVFEGIDGSGKSTQAKLLKAYLENTNIECVSTLEPTYGRVGTLLHEILSGKEKADPGVIAALFAADRLEHISEMEKSLKEGKTVISDRYYLSSLAYQSTDLPYEWVYALNERAMSILKPDYTFFVDVSPENSLSRIEKGRESFEIYENLEKLSHVRNKYLEIIDKLSSDENIFIIDGNKPVEEVFEDIKKLIN